MKFFFRIASFLYFSLLFYIFFLARRRPHPSLEPAHRPLHWKPFYYKYRFLRYYLFSSAKEQWGFYTDLLGNILLFIPFAIILSLVFNIKSKRRIVFISFICSVLIETTQFIFGIGVADIDDVILNTTGAVIGVLLLKAFHKSEHPLVQKFLYTF